MPPCSSASGYDLHQDLAPVAGLSAMPLVLAVNPELPVATVDELIDLAEAKPGGLRYASSGVGGSPHLAATEFNKLAGTVMTHLPQDGSGPAVAAVIAGAADLLFDTTVATLPAVRDGRLRGLAVTSDARSPAAPDLPTMAEAGLPGLVMLSWNGLMVPSGTPAAEVERLHAAVAQAMAAPEVLAELASLGATVQVTTPAEFGSALAEDIAAWGADRPCRRPGGLGMIAALLRALSLAALLVAAPPAFADAQSVSDPFVLLNDDGIASTATPRLGSSPPPIRW